MSLSEPALGHKVTGAKAAQRTHHSIPLHLRVQATRASVSALSFRTKKNPRYPTCIFPVCAKKGFAWSVSGQQIRGSKTMLYRTETKCNDLIPDIGRSGRTTKNRGNVERR
ncbi:hypothetical protein NE237_017128 [Protea cynaroides]|uniref:Uncharacterized protein n=1 Tax=Protea cynaroides TaxID=273540 RepID=A0A9Q0QMS8_9MAGN|nr:hypothetical protein NE237_017128 [Protea cynaroides]